MYKADWFVAYIGATISSQSAVVALNLLTLKRAPTLGCVVLTQIDPVGLGTVSLTLNSGTLVCAEIAKAGAA